MGYYYSISPILFMLISIILSILAIIFGATSYWGKWKDKLGLTDFIVGFIVVIIWFVTWIILFVYATGMLYGVPGYRPKVK